MTGGTPRCGRVMQRYEKPGRPVLEDPVCGRPAGHGGACRSEATISTYYAHRSRRDEVRRERYRRLREAGYAPAEALRLRDRGRMPGGGDERAA